LRLFEAGVFY